jgi:hypothetical protein
VEGIVGDRTVAVFTIVRHVDDGGARRASGESAFWGFVGIRALFMTDARISAAQCHQLTDPDDADCFSLR